MAVAKPASRFRCPSTIFPVGLSARGDSDVRAPVGLVDVARLTAYGVELPTATMGAQRFTLLAAVASALAGTLAGNYLVEKMTCRTIQLVVSVIVFGIAVSRCLGVV